MKDPDYHMKKQVVAAIAKIIRERDKYRAALEAIADSEQNTDWFDLTQAAVEALKEE